MDMSWNRRQCIHYAKRHHALVSQPNARRACQASRQQRVSGNSSLLSVQNLIKADTYLVTYDWLILKLFTMFWLCHWGWCYIIVVCDYWTAMVCPHLVHLLQCLIARLESCHNLSLYLGILQVMHLWGRWGGGQECSSHILMQILILRLGCLYIWG